MKESVERQVDLLISRYPILEPCKESIADSFFILKECFSTGHKLLIAGNGGSCADAEHIAGELMKGFKLPRKSTDDFINRLITIDSKRGKELGAKLQRGLPTIVLSNHQGLNTAFLNDVSDGGLFLFAQQIFGYGQEGDVFLAISTSGNSCNVLNAAVVAKALGLKVLGLTGQGGGELAGFADVTIKVPCEETFMVQELHLPVYHCLCLMLENHFFNKD